MKWRIVLGFLLFVGGQTSVQAIYLKGYRISETGDTIFGEIKKYKINQAENTLLLNGIDLERYHIEFFFKALGKNRKQRYTVADTREFGFTYAGQDYEFRRFELKKKSLSKAASQRNRFLQLVYAGELELYLNRLRISLPPSTQQVLTKTHSQVYPEQYLYSEILGLKRVEDREDAATLKALLLLYGVDEEFIDALPDKLSKKRLRLVLEEYDKWVLKKSAYRT